MKDQALNMQEQYLAENHISVNAKRKGLFVEIVTFLLILLFAYTGLSKLVNQHNFEAVIWGSVLIGGKAKAVSWAVIITELTIVLLLIVPRSRKLGLLSSSVLMLLFTLYVAYMLLFAAHKPCSCGGVIQKMSWKQHLVFNAIFTIMAYVAFKFSRVSRKQ